MIWRLFQTRSAIRIFLSYRRDDAAGWAGRLRSELPEHVPGASVFQDISSNEPGVDFVKATDRKLVDSCVALVLIGPRWLEVQPETSRPRLFEPDDLVRREIVRALEFDVRVIPVLLGDATMPKAEELPDAVQPLSTRHAIELTEEHWEEDVLRLGEAIQRVAGEKGATQTAGQRSTWLRAAGIALIVCVLAGSAWYLQGEQVRQREVEQLLVLGSEFMRTGRYLEAKAAYQQALQIAPRDLEVQFGARKATLPELKSDRESYGTELDALLKQKPGDKDLLLLDGDRHYFRNEFEEAAKRYEALLAKDERYPEALFRVGLLNELQGDVETARTYYQKAVKLSPDTPHYRNNLAHVYFLQGDYDRAIAEYGLIDRYPLAALEAAKAHWAKGELPEARDAQSRAIAWLESPEISSLPRNLGPWLFEAGLGKNARLVSNDEKLCYARLSLSATLFLEGKTAETYAPANIASSACPVFVKSVLVADLARVVSTHPELKRKADAFRRQYLAT